MVGSVLHSLPRTGGERSYIIIPRLAILAVQDFCLHGESALNFQSGGITGSLLKINSIVASFWSVTLPGRQTFP